MLALVAAGKSNACIAAELVLTKGAVEKHIDAIYLLIHPRHPTAAEAKSRGQPSSASSAATRSAISSRMVRTASRSWPWGSVRSQSR